MRVDGVNNVSFGYSSILKTEFKKGKIKPTQQNKNFVALAVDLRRNLGNQNNSSNNI